MKAQTKHVKEYGNIYSWIDIGMQIQIDSGMNIGKELYMGGDCIVYKYR